MSAAPAEPSSVLVSPCDGYAAGTTGTVVARHQGCVVFAPDRPERVARWARPRARLVVPAGFVERRARQRSASTQS